MMITAKECKQCKQTKDTEQFYKTKYNKDGLVSYCKPCWSDRKKVYTAKNKEAVSKSKAEYLKGVKSDPVKYEEYKKYYRDRKRNRYKDRTEYEIKKDYAVNQLNQAVIRGKIVRPDCCMYCDTKCKPQGHHIDYDEPLNVIWLCRGCHNDFHRIKKDYETVDRLNKKLDAGGY